MKMSMPSKTDLHGSDWQPVIHPEDLPGFTDHWKSMLVSGKPGEREARMRRFDGAYRWHLFRAVPLYDEQGNRSNGYASAFDIEDRKRRKKRCGGARLLSGSTEVDPYWELAWSVPPDIVSTGHRKTTACLASIRKGVYRQTKRLPAHSCRGSR